MVGEIVSHYRILEELGGGAMGIVYKAQDMRLKRLVALKFLPPGLTRDAVAKQRFVQEAEAASALDDPHVCTVHAIDETTDGRVFIAMGFYEGETLKKHIQRGPMPIGDVIAIAAQIARGLAAAHEAGIVHRDIKPANVMVTTRGEAKIVDFGIAKLSGQVGPHGHRAQPRHRRLHGARAVPRTGRRARRLVGARRGPPRDAHRSAAVPGRERHRVDERRPESDPADRSGRSAPMCRSRSRPWSIARCRRILSRRYSSAGEMATDIEACRLQTAAPAAVSDDTGAILRAIRRPLVALPALAVVGVLGYVLVTTLTAQSRTRWAREEAVPEIGRLLQQDEYAAAYALAQQAERYIPNDPVLTGLLPQITATPALADQARRRQCLREALRIAAGEWRLIGTTPLEARGVAARHLPVARAVGGVRASRVRAERRRSRGARHPRPGGDRECPGGNGDPRREPGAGGHHGVCHGRPRRPRAVCHRPS